MRDAPLIVARSGVSCAELNPNVRRVRLEPDQGTVRFQPDGT
jgi:hypothetical protein